MVEHELIKAQISSLNLLEKYFDNKESEFELKEKSIMKSLLKALLIFDANNTCMTFDECASFLNVHKNTVRKMVHDRKIVATYVGRWAIPKLQFIERLIKEDV